MQALYVIYNIKIYAFLAAFNIMNFARERDFLVGTVLNRYSAKYFSSRLPHIPYFSAPVHVWIISRHSR